MGALGRVADRRFADISVGSPLQVQIQSLSEDMAHDIVVELPARTFAAGETVTGVVVRLAEDTHGYGPPLAVIELVPNVAGVLHHSNAPRGFLRLLCLGQFISLEVIGSHKNKHGETEYDVRAGG